MQVARLQSQLAAAQLDVQTAREQAALAAIEGPVRSSTLQPLTAFWQLWPCVLPQGQSGPIYATSPQLFMVLLSFHWVTFNASCCQILPMAVKDRLLNGLEQHCEQPCSICKRSPTESRMELTVCARAVDSPGR